MNLSGIIAISGKGGLFTIAGQSKNNVIVESVIDGKKFPAFASNRISALEDISIYTYEGDELLSNIYILILNILGYKYFGLDGLGISFFISYIFIFIQIYLIAKSKFDFNYTRDFIKIFYFQFTLALISFISIKYITEAYIYIVGVVLTITSICYTYRELDKRIVIKEFINKLKN